MFTTISNARRVRTVAALGISAVALLCSGVAGAAPKKTPTEKPPLVYVEGGGTATTDEAGVTVVTGPAQVADPRTGEALDATLTAVLVPFDGTLPDPETCEPASATITVEGGRKVAMTLVGAGEVCGVYPQSPYIVTHVFTGRYEVVEAGMAKRRGTDGFFEIRLGLGGIGSAFAVDT